MNNKPHSFWTYKKLSEATKGSWHKNSLFLSEESLKDISFDSRTIQKDDIFIAIRGVEKDGHNYIKQAMQDGASAIIADNPLFIPKNPKTPILLVDDTQKALENLGIYARNHIEAVRIAITGSVGKTSTKDMIYHAFKNQKSSWSNPRSFNNKWGVPYTLANMPANTQYGIFEIGTNHEGEIEPLSKQIKPHIALITTVGAAHLENFPSFEHLLYEKASIFKGLQTNGYAVLPRDHKNYKMLLSVAQENPSLNIVTFGFHQESDICILESRPCIDGLQIAIKIYDTVFEKKVHLFGKHWAYNIACTLAVANIVKLNLHSTLENIQTFEEPIGRGKRHTFKVPTSPEEKFVFIDQTYNANPLSMSAALESFQKIPVENKGRRISIIGDMMETGTEKEALQHHECIEKDIDINRLNTLITVGKLSKALHEKVKNSSLETYHFQTIQDALKFLIEFIKPYDCIMAKASLSMNFFPTLVNAFTPYPCP